MEIPKKNTKKRSSRIAFEINPDLKIRWVEFLALNFISQKVPSGFYFWPIAILQKSLLKLLMGQNLRLKILSFKNNPLFKKISQIRQKR